jgi:DNA-binding response OmpR family regulator
MSNPVTAAVPAPAPQPPAVVLCEPDTSLRELMSEWLRRAGFQPLIPEGGGPVARAVLVIADVPEPRRNGAARIAILRQRFAGAKVLAISAQFLSGIQAASGAALELGADAMLAKPFASGAFIDAVRALTGW